MSEKRTRLAEKRTELAYERTVLAYIRTGATAVLFGVAFLGFSEVRHDFFFYAGIFAVVLGVIFILLAVRSSIRHLDEINRIKSFFGGIIHKVGKGDSGKKVKG